jgi:hypothetical protein
VAIGSGIGSQLGAATESTYGTSVTPARFFEYDSESIDFDKTAQQGTGMRAGGQVVRANRRVVTMIGGKGDVQMDVPSKGFGFWLALAFGGTPTSAQQAATAAYLHTFTPGDLLGKMATVQVGVPQLGGTVTPKTALGCKVTDLELTAGLGEILTAKIGLDAADVRTDVALATASYAAGATTNVFHFAEGAITIGGSAIAGVRSATVKLDNGLKTDRRHLGGLGKKAEPVIADYRKITGKLDAEFIDTTFSAAYLTDAALALVLTFTGPLIASTYFETLKITVPVIKLDSQMPDVGGADIVDLSVDFVGLDDGTNPPIKIEYTSTDVTP